MFNEGKLVKNFILNNILSEQVNLFLEANISLTKAEVKWIKDTASLIIQNIIDLTQGKTDNWEFTGKLKLKNKNNDMPIIYSLTNQGNLAYSIDELRSSIEHELVHHLDSISRQGAGKGYYQNTTINDYYNSSHEKNAHTKQLISVMENNILNITKSTVNANPGVPIYNLFNKIIQTSMDIACIYNKELLGFITGCDDRTKKVVYKEIVQYFQKYF